MFQSHLSETQFRTPGKDIYLTYLNHIFELLEINLINYEKLMKDL